MAEWIAEDGCWLHWAIMFHMRGPRAPTLGMVLLVPPAPASHPQQMNAALSVFFYHFIPFGEFRRASGRGAIRHLLAVQRAARAPRPAVTSALQFKWHRRPAEPS